MLPLLALISSVSALAGDLGSAHESRARESVQRLVQQDPGFAEFKTAVEDAWKKKCGKAKFDDRSCWLLECDVAPAGECRADRVLLFRGESGLYPTPSVSSLVRAHWSGSRYGAGKDAQGLLQQLASDIRIIRPIYFGPDEGESFLLQRKADGVVDADRWIYGPTHADEAADESFDRSKPIIAHPEKPGREPTPEAALMQLLFKFHAQFSYFTYDDPEKGIVGLDPMISYSLDPGVCLAFSRPDDPKSKKPGRLIVASVPLAEITRDCGEKLPEPGQIWDPSGCEDDGQFEEEKELGAFVYLSPDYAWTGSIFVTRRVRMKKLIFLLLVSVFGSQARADVILSVEHRIPRDFFAQLQRGFETARKQAQDEMGKDYPSYVILASEGKNLPILLVCEAGAPRADGTGCVISVSPAARAKTGEVSVRFSLPIREDAVAQSAQELALLETLKPDPNGDHLHVLRPFFKGEDPKDTGTHVYCAPEELADKGAYQWQCYLSVAQRF